MKSKGTNLTFRSFRPVQVIVNTKEKDNLFNLVSFNFLGLSFNPIVKQKVKQALGKYGVGTCGVKESLFINQAAWLLWHNGCSS
jgi:7-keto-8-aminopelargonate synthetase-like enzyme